MTYRYVRSGLYRGTTVLNPLLNRFFILLQRIKRTYNGPFNSFNPIWITCRGGRKLKRLDQDRSRQQNHRDCSGSRKRPEATRSGVNGVGSSRSPDQQVSGATSGVSPASSQPAQVPGTQIPESNQAQGLAGPEPATPGGYHEKPGESASVFGAG